MANPFVRILLVSILLIEASTGRADDVTDITSEMPMSTTILMEEAPAQTSPAPTASNAPSATELVDVSSQETPAITTAGFSSNVPVDDVTVTPSSAPVVPVDGSSSLTVAEGTTTAENNSSSTFIPETTTTASPTNPAAEMSSTTTAATSPALSTTTTTTEAVTTPPLIAETTTVEKRSTTTSSSTVYHECVTSVPCIDPNSHCVNMGGLNTCQCRMGFRKSLGGLCLVIPFTAAITSTSTTTTTSTPETSTHPIVPTAAPAPIPKREMAKQASELTQDEKLDVVTLGLLPISSVVEWLLVQDIHFRTAIAKVLTSTNFTHQGEEKPKTINVSANQIVYVAPSPQMTSNDGLLVAFLVKDNEGVSPGHRFPQGGIIARHRREENSNPPTGYFPSEWIIEAIREHENILETHLNQNISLIYGGVAPSLLYSTDQIASASLFERRLDVFIPLIFVVALCCMALAISLFCIRAKSKSKATWDPPAGVIFGKTTLKREDPQGSSNRMESVGHDLATDEQCRDGEDQQSLKHSSRSLQADDDVWVVPYDDGMSIGQSPNHLRTQFEDTKL